MNTQSDADLPVFDPEFAGAAASLATQDSPSSADAHSYVFGADMGEFDSEGFLGPESLPPDGGAVDPEPSPVQVEKPPPAPPVTPRRRRSLPIPVVLGLSGLLLAAGGAYWYMRAPHASDQASTALARNEMAPSGIDTLPDPTSRPNPTLPIAEATSVDTSASQRRPLPGPPQPGATRTDIPLSVSRQPAATSPGAPSRASRKTSTEVSTPESQPSKHSAKGRAKDATPDGSGATAPQKMRVLKFPRDDSIGVVYTAPWDSTDVTDWSKVGDAMATIPVLPGKRIHLIVNVDNLAALDGLDANALDMVTLKNSAIDDDDLEHLLRFTSLTSLKLGDANISDAAKERLQMALPNCTIR